MSARTVEHGPLTAEERAALRERTREARASARRGSATQKAAEAEQAVLERIAEMADADRAVAERVHAVITATAPSLAPRLWYGMPAYAHEGKVLCFFQSAEKFNARYATLGFSDRAALDDGAMWAASFAIAAISPQVEARIARLITRALE